MTLVTLGPCNLLNTPPTGHLTSVAGHARSARTCTGLSRPSTNGDRCICECLEVSNRIQTDPGIVKLLSRFLIDVQMKCYSKSS